MLRDVTLKQHFLVKDKHTALPCQQQVWVDKIWILFILGLYTHSHRHTHTLSRWDHQNLSLSPSLFLLSTLVPRCWHYILKCTDWRYQKSRLALFFFFFCLHYSLMPNLKNGEEWIEKRQQKTHETLSLRLDKPMTGWHLLVRINVIFSSLLLLIGV